MNETTQDPNHYTIKDYARTASLTVNLTQKEFNKTTQSHAREKDKDKESLVSTITNRTVYKEPVH